MASKQKNHLTQNFKPKYYHLIYFLGVEVANGRSSRINGLLGNIESSAKVEHLSVCNDINSCCGIRARENCSLKQFVIEVFKFLILPFQCNWSSPC